MKPTMPMNAFPPGSFPGHPSGAGAPPGGTPPPGGGWGPPPGGPPSGPGGYPPPAQPPPKKGKTGLYVGAGCGCLLVLFCIVGGVIGFFQLKKLGMGDEVTSTQVSLGQPFSASYVQSGNQRYAAWLEVDVNHPGGYQLDGSMILSENNTPFGQYTVRETGTGSPVVERSSSTRTSWNRGGSSSSGNVQLFPIPARSSGSTVTVSGTLRGTAGMSGSVRLIIAERN